MPNIYKFNYCKPVPLGDWNAFDHLKENLEQLDSDLKWQDFQLTEKERKVTLTHKGYKYER